jgi:hypothetical protein
VLVSFLYLLACRLFALVLLLARSDCSLEILLLRHAVGAAAASRAAAAHRA